VAALFLGTITLAHAAAPVAPARAPELETIPFTLDGWTGRPAPPLAPDVARVLAADRYVHRYYSRSDAAPIEMDVAYYAQPRVGANLHSPLNCLPGNGWTMAEPRTASVVTAGSAWEVREVSVARGSARFAMAYWFQSRQRVVGDEIAARLHLLGDALHRRPTDASLVRLIAPATGASAADHSALTSFAAALIPQLAERLGGAD
jgi:EpsI family protein